RPQRWVPRRARVDLAASEEEACHRAVEEVVVRFTERVDRPRVAIGELEERPPRPVAGGERRLDVGFPRARERGKGTTASADRALEQRTRRTRDDAREPRHEQDRPRAALAALAAMMLAGCTPAPPPPPAPVSAPAESEFRVRDANLGNGIAVR